MKGIITEDYVKRGIEFIRKNNTRLPDGNINMYFMDMQYRSCDIENGTVEYDIYISDKCVNRRGSVHGGYQAGLLDETAGWTIHVMKACCGFRATTGGINVQYMKPIPVNCTIQAVVRILHMGRRTAVTSCEFYYEGKLCTVANENWIVLNPGTEYESENGEIDEAAVLETMVYRGNMEQVVQK